MRIEKIRSLQRLNMKIDGKYDNTQYERNMDRWKGKENE